MKSSKNRPSRGRPSSIDLLPEDIRLQLNEALRDRRLTQKEIRQAINELLEKRGKTPVSRSAINRYSIHVEEKGSMMREAREAADALVGGLKQDGTDLGQAVTEMMKTIIFDRILNNGEDIDEDAINKLSLAAQRIENASKIGEERKEKLRRQAIEEAADTVEETAIQSGMNEEQAQLWREKVLGIK
jgi:hypothetical protein